MKVPVQIAAVASALLVAAGQAGGAGMSPNQAVHSPAIVTHNPAKVTLNRQPVTFTSAGVRPHCPKRVAVPIYPYCYPVPLSPGVYRSFGYDDDEEDPVGGRATRARPVSSAEWNYYQSGRDWGQDLRREVTTWEKFVSYVKSYVVRAQAPLREEFRRGFLEGYGLNAAAAFDEAVQEAGAPPAPTGPKVIVVAPRPPSGH